MKKIAVLFLLISTGSFAQDIEKIIDQGYEKYLAEDYKGAILDFGKALSYDEDNPEVYYLRGVSKSALGEKRGAMEDLNRATELEPAYAEAYYEKGYIFLTDQNAERAIKEFDQAIQHKPDFAEAYVSRGTARCMLEDRSGAEKDWIKAKGLGIGYTEFMICE